MFGAAMMALPTMAQETYQMAQLETQDLNGTARYVGMSGAMNALGADISTIGSNPAGIGIFRHGQLTFSGGLLRQNGVEKVGKQHKMNPSFDQLGFVYSTKPNYSGTRVSFAFNYHKSRNFSQILSAAAGLNRASQNKLTSMKFNSGVIGSYNKEGNNGAGSFNEYEYAITSVDRAYIDELLKSDTDNGVDWYDANQYAWWQENHGFISNFDFNISASFNDRVFLGATIGVKDVHYHTDMRYMEAMDFSPNDANPLGSIFQEEVEKITGTGVDFSLGAIFLPIEGSPFRIGAWLKSPTFYDLDNRVDMEMKGAPYINSAASVYNGFMSHRFSDYNFKFNTPWKFGLAMGSTIGNQFAFDVEYEFADYNSTDARQDNNDYYDYYYGDVYSTTSSDKEMNRSVKQALKGVSTFRVGFEYKPVPELAFRMGYNYVSPMYDKYGFRDPTLQARGNNLSARTDFTNWRETNRVTAGLGYKFAKKWNLDLAYQFASTRGEFFPFATYTYHDRTDPNAANYDNIGTSARVKDIRSQFLMTLGYSF